MAVVSIHGLTKYYGDNLVLDHIDLEVGNGTLVSLLGPSGCGKTTTLRLIAGFEQASGGDIFIDEQRINDVGVNKRNIGMVFQSYALFPHMSVEKNIAYGLEQRKIPREEIDRRVKDIVRLVKLEGFEKRKPKQLSGGQQQRVALARALVIKPSILLLDECLSALDKKLRVEMQVELRRILESQGITTLFVTHDQEEAMTISDLIVVMRAGIIEQIGAPYEVYEHPRNRFVAGFLGKANFFEGKVSGTWENGVILDTAAGTIKTATRETAEVGKGAVYAVRPEKMRIQGERQEGCLQGQVQFVTYAGNISTYTVDWNGQQLLVEEQNLNGAARVQPGETVSIGWEEGSCHRMEDPVEV